MKTTTTTLLHINASPRGARSKSRQLGADFLATWQAARPDARIVRRDLANEPPPFVTEAWVEGAFAPADQQSPAARDAIAVSNRYIDELLAADTLVITTPIYNLSLPAALKAWIDQIVRFGRTFTMNNGAYDGLAKGKRAVIIVASGSDFRPNTPGGAYNFLEPYLRGVLGFIGISDVQFVYGHSVSQGDAGLAEAKSALAQLATAA
jgi:FMN-dependent NADH-azoreductase